MRSIPLILLSTLWLSCQSQSAKINKSHSKQSWTFSREATTPRRGGTTTGQKVEFSNEVSAGWRKLKGLKGYQRDRAAIKALAGVYKTSFEFLETWLPHKEKEFDRPYQSWGTEWVFVVEDKKNFISLQHLMVMYFVNPKTKKIEGPMVMKHWRQDWEWQAKTYFEYQGDETWKKKRIQDKGYWKWSVYQVDDSPRYQGIGKWKHYQNTAVFETEALKRPLPRRERTVRKDYQILGGRDRLVLTPHGWYHEQNNLKLTTENKIQAGEIGLNKYLPIEKFDYSAGVEYWKRTKRYWQSTRQVWAQTLAKSDRFQLKKKVDGQFLFMQSFSDAEASLKKFSSISEEKKAIKKLIQKYFEQL